MDATWGHFHAVLLLQKLSQHMKDQSQHMIYLLAESCHHVQMLGIVIREHR